MYGEFCSISIVTIVQRILAQFLTRRRGLGTDGQLICASLFLHRFIWALGTHADRKYVLFGSPHDFHRMECDMVGLLGGLHHSGGPASSCISVVKCSGLCQSIKSRNTCDPFKKAQAKQAFWQNPIFFDITIIGYNWHRFAIIYYI